jgi:hypothetical protein
MTFAELKKMLDAKDKSSSVRKRAMDDDLGYVYDPKNPPKSMSRKEMYEAMEDMKSEKGYSKGGLVKGFKGTF